MSTATTTSGEPTTDDGRATGHGMLERPVSRHRTPDTPSTRLRGRPELYTAYEQDMALLNTPGKRVAAGIGLLVLIWLGFWLPTDWTLLLATSFVTAIGAIGLNIVTGMAGQVSLGHAFFIGIGTFTAAIIAGPTDDFSTFGLGIDVMAVWLPAAGLVSMLAGLIVAPLALRLKGLYLAIVTLGLVFLGEHIFRVATPLTGGVGVGRNAARAGLFGFDFAGSGEVLGVSLDTNARHYFLLLFMLVVFGVVARNIARSDLGRAFSAVRDRDIAAEVIGVDLTRAKVLAFAISSFYAGITGALLYSLLGRVEPGSFNLIMSIEYIAMILIGGIATVSGAILGATFLTVLSRFSQELVNLLPGAISVSPELLEAILAGVLLIAFLILEPRGLFGIWNRTRTYWKAWPFSY